MNIPYSHICGRVQAFWFGTPDGFAGSQRSSTTINGNYVDGISLTYGTSNKTHKYGHLLLIMSEVIKTVLVKYQDM